MTRDELRENVRCSLFDEQDTDAVMADVDRYVKALLQQTPCTTMLEFLRQMMKDEGKSAIATPSFSKMEKHYANADDIKNVMRLIKERQPIA